MVRGSTDDDARGRAAAYYYQLADPVNAAVAQTCQRPADAVRIFRQALSQMVTNNLLPMDAFSEALGLGND